MSNIPPSTSSFIPGLNLLVEVDSQATMVASSSQAAPAIVSAVPGVRQVTPDLEFPEVAVPEVEFEEEYEATKALYLARVRRARAQREAEEERIRKEREAEEERLRKEREAEEERIRQEQEAEEEKVRKADEAAAAQKKAEEDAAEAKRKEDEAKAKENERRPVSTSGTSTPKQGSKRPSRQDPEFRIVGMKPADASVSEVS
jgi:type IV secretory pathway VirB10-like protein